MRAPVGLIAAVFVLAGCSASCRLRRLAGRRDHRARSLIGGQPSAAPDGSVAPTGGTTATCKQLTFDQVQPLLDAPITNVEVTAAGLSGGGQECRFEAADPSANVDVIVVGGDDGTTQYNGDVVGVREPGPAARRRRQGDVGLE